MKLEAINRKTPFSEGGGCHGMNMTLVNALRKLLGWPDSHGKYQYRNAAVLCYLTTCRRPLNSFTQDEIAFGRWFVEEWLYA